LWPPPYIASQSADTQSTRHSHLRPSRAHPEERKLNRDDAAAGEAALIAFDEGIWGRKYPAIGQSWRRAWGEVTPFYAFPADVRRILYTTNAIEALNSKLRRPVDRTPAF
jgi:transposase-like protein